jgi:integrase
MVRYHHVELHKVLRVPVKWGLVSRNVADSVDVPRARRIEMQTWDEDDAARFGLKVIRLHDARHAHASLMLKQGVHPKIVQERLGHATIAVTLDTYSHVAPGLQEAVPQPALISWCYRDLNMSL